jgi:hypothetical protein
MPDNGRTKAANHWLWIAFSLVWFVLVGLSYWAFHPYYSVALGRFPNLGMAVPLFAVTGVALGALAFWPGRQKSKGGRAVPGLALYGFILLLQLIALGVYGSKQQLFGGSLAAALGYFLGYSLMLHGAIFLLVLIHYLIGQALVQKLAPWYARDSQRVLSLAAGISLGGLVLVLLGLAGLLYGWLLWVLAAGVLLWQRQAAWSFVTELLWKSKLRLPEERWGLLPILLLLVAIAVNSIAALKLFPVGFDGAALYMNTTKLISDYQALPQGGQAFNWQIFLSLGDLLFGQMSISILLSHFSVFFSLFALYRLSRLFLNRSASWLVAALFYLNPAVSFHVVVDEKIDLGFLFITLSMLLLVLEYAARLKGKKAMPAGQPLFHLGRWAVTEQALILAMAGWLAGYAFGVKYIGLMSILAMLVYVVQREAGTKAGIGALALLLGLLFPLGVYRFGYLELDGASPWLFAGLSWLVALPLLVWSWRAGELPWRPLIAKVLLFALPAALAFLPWAGKNLYENRQLSFQALVEGKLEEPQIRLDVEEDIQRLYQRGLEMLQERGIILERWQEEEIQEYIRRMGLERMGPEERRDALTQVRFFIYNRVLSEGQRSSLFGGQAPGTMPEARREREISGAVSSQRAVREEIKRYLGYEPGLPRYLSIPYDLTVNTNIDIPRYLDIGFIFLLFFPLLFFSRRWWKNAIMLAVLAVLWVVSVYSLYAAAGLPTDALVNGRINGLLANRPGALVGPLGEAFRALQIGTVGLGRSLHGLYVWLSGFSFLAIFASLLGLTGLGFFLFRERLPILSVPFKGLLVFTFSFGFLWFLLGNAIVWYAFALFSLLLLVWVYFFQKPEKLSDAVPLRYTRYWMGAGLGLYLLWTTALVFINTTKPRGSEQLLYLSPFLKHACGLQSTYDTYASFIPFLSESIEALNKNPEDKIYRVGTYFNYHIRFNDQRVLEDNQLAVFEQVSSQLNDKREFFRLLRNNGFKYVLFDLGTAAMDQTPEQSLSKKAQEFYNLLIYSPDATLLYTDNFVQDPAGGQYRFGNTIKQGKPGIFGTLSSFGTYILYELK